MNEHAQVSEMQTLLDDLAQELDNHSNVKAKYVLRESGLLRLLEAGQKLVACCKALRKEGERVRLETLEEVATFAETHYCIIDWERGPDFYKTEKRESKHPKEPFAMAIRALAAQGASK